jgi:hypothetical protein
VGFVAHNQIPRTFFTFLRKLEPFRKLHILRNFLVGIFGTLALGANLPALFLRRLFFPLNEDFIKTVCLAD